MLHFVDVGPRSLSNYRGLAPDNLLNDLIMIAKDLKGARVVHINATPYGGGVSEMLRSSVPILNDLGSLHTGRQSQATSASSKLQRKSTTDFKERHKT
jgi:hypothetical protein